MRGFPFELEREFGPNTIISKPDQINNIFNPYLLTFLFWFSGILTLLLLLQHPKRKDLLIFTGFIFGIAFLLMSIETGGEDSCLKGYPVTFFTECGVAPANNPYWFFYWLNFTFWAITALVGTSVFFYSYKSTYKLIKKFIPPLILTICSLVFTFPDLCTGICILTTPEGRGFPLPFSDGNLIIFFIDYVFWLIAYKFVVFIKQLTKPNVSSQISPVSSPHSPPLPPQENNQENNV